MNDVATSPRRVKPPALPRRFAWKALPLSERLRRLAPGSGGELTARQAALAERQIERLGAAAGGRALEAWLERLGASRDTLARALEGAPPRGDGAKGERSDWQEALRTVLAPTFIDAVRPPGLSDVSGLLFPFTAWAEQRLRAGFRRLGWRSDPSPLGAGLVRVLAERLYSLAMKPLLLEMHIMRLSGRLPGATGTERLAAFVHAVGGNGRELRRLFLRYPALARLMAIACVNWERNVMAMLGAFANDRERLTRELFGGCDPGEPDGVSGNLSDPHEGGKGVMILSFAGGQRLVYKPRDIRVDAQFQRFLSWLNEHGLELELPRLTCVAGHDYGWMEFVPSTPAADRPALGRFYARQGAYLAILHVLLGADFHSENVIANGEWPLLVDLEALFHNRPPLDATGYVASAAERRLFESVMYQGLLPAWALGTAEQAAPDISGLGNSEGQLYEQKSDMIEGLGTDEMRVVKGHAPVPTRHNRPKVGDEAGNVAEFEPQLREGFRRTYRFLLEHRDALLAHDGPLSAFAGVRVRQVLRPTMTYDSALRRALHPDFLTDTIHLECALAALGSSVEFLSILGRVIDAEMRSLAAGDIPKFTSRPDTCAVVDDLGHEYSDFFGRPALVRARERVELLSEDHLAWQDQVVRMSVRTLLKQGEPGTEYAPPWPIPAEPAAPAALLDEARVLAEHLCDTAAVDEHGADWWGLGEGTVERLRFGAVGYDFYGGCAGIAVFLAYAGREFANQRHFDLADAAMQTALRMFRARDFPWGGGLTGRGGVACAMLHLASLRGRTTWVDEVLSALPELVAALPADDAYDVVAGSAGLIPMLLGLHRLTGAAEALQAATRCGEHLIASRQSLARGCGWPNRRAPAPLTGFAHGAAGVGWALSHLAAATGEPRFGDVGRAAFEYERALFLPEVGNWPDLRPPLSGPPRAGVQEAGVAWCHGAPGIGLSRGTLPPALRGSEEQREVDLVLAKLLPTGAAATDSLCHGELGNADILLSIGRAMGRPDLEALARRRVTAALERRQSRGRWRCGSVPDDDVPTLFTGLAGIGYGLMRIARPERVPCLLTLEPPRGAAG